MRTEVTKGLASSQAMDIWARDCPGAFAMVPYIEHADGVYHINGGLSHSAEAMTKVIRENKGEIFYNKKECIIFTTLN